jgi:hypothetical protein
MSAAETLDVVLCDITAESALVIRGAVTPFLEQVEGWEAKVALVDDPRVARASRLVLKAMRCDADKVRKGLKDESLKFGRSVDAAFNKFADRVQPLEATLLDIEQAAERAEAARINALEVERTKELAAYEVRLVGLGSMTAETYAQLLFNSRVGHEAKLEAGRKAEAERIAAENARLVEEARIRAENEKLKAEALAAAETARVEKERVEALAAEERKKAAAAAKAAAAKAKAERDAIEAAAKVERERLAVIAAEAQERTEKARAAAESQACMDRMARLEVEAQLKAVADAKRAADEAEVKRQADEAEAQRQASLAPDKEKLLALAMDLRATGTPALSTADGQAVIALLVTKLDRLAAWLEQEASVL